MTYHLILSFPFFKSKCINLCHFSDSNKVSFSDMTVTDKLSNRYFFQLNQQDINFLNELTIIPSRMDMYNFT